MGAVGRAVEGREGLCKRLCWVTISSRPQPSGLNIHSPLITTATGLISPEETQPSDIHCTSFFLVCIRYSVVKISEKNTGHRATRTGGCTTRHACWSSPRPPASSIPRSFISLQQTQPAASQQGERPQIKADTSDPRLLMLQTHRRCHVRAAPR